MILQAVSPRALRKTAEIVDSIQRLGEASLCAAGSWISERHRGIEASSFHSAVKVTIAIPMTRLAVDAGRWLLPKLGASLPRLLPGGGLLRSAIVFSGAFESAIASPRDWYLFAMDLTAFAKKIQRGEDWGFWDYWLIPEFFTLLYNRHHAFRAWRSIRALDKGLGTTEVLRPEAIKTLLGDRMGLSSTAIPKSQAGLKRHEHYVDLVKDGFDYRGTKEDFTYIPILKTYKDIGVGLVRGIEHSFINFLSRGDEKTRDIFSYGYSVWARQAFKNYEANAHCDAGLSELVTRSQTSKELVTIVSEHATTWLDFALYALSPKLSSRVRPVAAADNFDHGPAKVLDWVLGIPMVPRYEAYKNVDEYLKASEGYVQKNKRMLEEGLISIIFPAGGRNPVTWTNTGQRFHVMAYNYDRKWRIFRSGVLEHVVGTAKHHHMPITIVTVGHPEGRYAMMISPKGKKRFPFFERAYRGEDVRATFTLTRYGEAGQWPETRDMVEAIKNRYIDGLGVRKMLRDYFDAIPSNAFAGMEDIDRARIRAVLYRDDEVGDLALGWLDNLMGIHPFYPPQDLDGMELFSRRQEEVIAFFELLSRQDLSADMLKEGIRNTRQFVQQYPHDRYRRPSSKAAKQFAAELSDL